MLELIELLKISVGKAKTLEEPWSEEQWESVYAEAKKQAVLGVCFKAIEALPEEQKPSRRIKVQWALAAEKIATFNHLLDAHASEITKAMSALGPKSCVIKGQGLAMLYPYPDSRQSGDIDLWINVNHKQLVPVLRTNWTVGDVFYHHAEVKAFSDGTSLEVHFHPSWMNDPFANRKLMKWFDSNAPEQFENYFLDKGFSMPTVAFNCVFCMLHIYRHTLHEGIGVRQLMDYYYILQHSGSEERAEAFRTLKSLKMHRFVAAVMYVEQKLFSLDDKYLLCTPDKHSGSLLLREISMAGNFGHADSKTVQMEKGNIFVRAYAKFVRLSRFIPIAPSEVLWAPFFKIWQWCWRIKNHYC